MSKIPKRLPGAAVGMFLATSQAAGEQNTNPPANSSTAIQKSTTVSRDEQMIGLRKEVDDAEAAYKARKGDSKAASRQAQQLFETVIKQYTDCPVYTEPKSTLGERARPELYELRHLSVGSVAPEIEGEDIDGKILKLSDQRGKVVVLSFWGSWCGPCMQTIEHERTLAERMAGKPFALLGVNSDVDRADAKRAVEKKKVTWRSFWDGTNGSDGPISAAWNVRGWPTVYVLDPKGAIRLKFEGFGGTDTDNLLNGTVDCLLKEFGDANEMKPR